MIDAMKRNLLKAIGLGALSGCAAAQSKGRSVSIVKYNYTDRYIGDVMVDGAWTGGVDAYGGGSKMAEGLMAPLDTFQAAVLKVKWVVADVYDLTANKYSRRPDEQREALVEVSRPYPVNPDYLVPDRKVEIAMRINRLNLKFGCEDSELCEST